MPNEQRNILESLENVDLPSATTPDKPAPIVPVPTPEPAASTQPSITLTGDQLSALLEKTVSAVVDKIPQPSLNITPFQPSQPTSPDPDDILSEIESVTFAMLGAGWMTRSYMRNGQTIIAPYGLIEFKPSIEEIRTNAKGENDVLRISTYSCRSKKEIEYLENHPEFGLTFREATGNNISAMVNDPDKLNTQMVAPFIAQINGMTELAKKQMAMDNDIDITDPNVNIDNELALLLVKQTEEALQSMKARKLDSLGIKHNR